MRDIEVKKLRPQIPTIIDENVSSSAELFQNRSLRQILKLQNDLLLQIFKFYILKRKGVFYKLSEPKKLEYIEQSIRKDIKFKNLLLGTIIGHYTEQEWLIYSKNEKELSRRITTMLIQRIQSQVGEL